MRINLRSASASVIVVALLSVALADPAAAVGVVPTSRASSTTDIVPNGELTAEQVKILLLPSSPAPPYIPQMPAGDYSSLMGSDPLPPPLAPPIMPPISMPGVTRSLPAWPASGWGGGTAAGGASAAAQTPSAAAPVAQRVMALRTARVLAGPVPSTWADAGIRGAPSWDQRAGRSVVRDPLLHRPH